MGNTAPTSSARQMLNKVPEITLFFWIIKILSTTVGETGADLIDETFNIGLDGLTLIFGSILVVTLVAQFKSKKYVPGIYWLTVVLISIVGTLITDDLTDNYEVPLEVSTIIFTILLAGTFAIWYKKEKTLSIHAINTTKREAFYWIAILFTFSLGTAAGDLLSETMELGYLLSMGIFGGLILAIAIAHFGFKLHSVFAFWMVYILTRPLGASIGDFLSQDLESGGIELGTIITSIFFLTAILITVIYLTVSKRDVIEKNKSHDDLI
jgi:uncharacterized membrane-anchored protein